MIKFFRNLPRRQAGIRKKLLAESKIFNPTFARASLGTYLKYAIEEIILVVIVKTTLCPVRDKTWVETNKDVLNPRAFRYDILYIVPKGTIHHFYANKLPR